MQELFQQILEHAHGIWRFRRYAIVTAWAVAIAGWAFLFFLPDVYQADSRIFVDTKTALKPVLQGIVIDQDVNGQLNLVRQSLLSQAQLEPIAEDTGLVDKRSMTTKQIASTLESMRSRVEVTVTPAGADGGERDAGNIYGIHYKDSSRERALKIVEVLKTLFIENTLGGKRAGTENAQKFLETQIADYEARLRAAEDRLAAFKKTNVGMMPTDQGGYFTRLQGEIDAANKTESALALATSRRDELKRQLRGEAPAAAATGFVGIPGTPGAGSGGGTLARIKEAQARLDDLLLRFTDKHPDVVAARATLVQLTERQENEIAALRRGDPGAAASSGASANPVYQSIQLALNQAEVEIASLRRELTNHRTRVAESRQSLDTMPQVEAEYARLNRDYDVTKANYTALVERLEKSRLGEEASTSGSVKFDVIEPPNAAFNPISPHRQLLVLAILLAAIGAGGGLAAVLHLFKPVFNSSRELASVTGLHVLGAVSLFQMEARQTLLKRSFVLYGLSLLALIGGAIVVLELNRAGVRLPVGTNHGDAA